MRAGLQHPDAPAGRCAVLVLGASGLLGRALVAAPFGEPVVGTARSRLRPGLVHMDVFDQGRIAKVMREVRPRLVINAIGERRPERWEESWAVQLNGAIPGVIARHCREAGARLLHISSDYVFDGTLASCGTSAPRRPLNVYGNAKVAAEDAVRAACPEAIVLRLPVLYGPVESLEESTVSGLLRTVLDGRRCQVDHWAVRYPTLTTDVAGVVVQIAGRNEELSGGTYHWSAAQGMTKLEMARTIGAVLGRSTDHLVPDLDPPGGAARPRQVRLDCSDLERRGIGRRTDFTQALTGLLPCWTGR
jgi:dTDP-4-dehydrorhamnose reductase